MLHFSLVVLLNQQQSHIGTGVMSYWHCIVLIIMCKCTIIVDLFV